MARSRRGAQKDGGLAHPLSSHHLPTPNGQHVETTHAQKWQCLQHFAYRPTWQYAKNNQMDIGSCCLLSPTIGPLNRQQPSSITCHLRTFQLEMLGTEPGIFGMQSTQDLFLPYEPAWPWRSASKSPLRGPLQSNVKWASIQDRAFSTAAVNCMDFIALLDFFFFEVCWWILGWYLIFNQVPIFIQFASLYLVYVFECCRLES